jgi:hypothetical protein
MQILNGEDGTARAKAGARRLAQLPSDQLAAAIMPVFGPEGPPVRRLWWGAHGIEVLQICDWLMRDSARGYRQRPRLRSAVTRALHLLEDAGLIENTRGWTRVGSVGATLRATARGQVALADGTVNRLLGLR